MSLNVVLGHALALVVHNAEVELGPGVALDCGLAIPLHRLGVVLDHAPAIGVHKAKVGLP